MKITFHGHSCFSLRTSDYTVLIDPWIKGNPNSDLNFETLECDFILVSHGHFDHLGDAISISKRTGAIIIGIVELTGYCEKQGAKAHGMQIGGGYQFPFGFVYLTPALHGSSIIEENLYLGLACGFVIELDGKYIYHAGDTGVFSDMRFIGRKFPLDLALLPIGDNFTMGPEDALVATSLLQAQKIIPMHYNTFDIITQDPYNFKNKVETNNNGQCIILSPGEELHL